MRGACRAAACLLLVGAFDAGAAQPASRISRRADDRDRVVLRGNLPSPALRTFDQGRLEAGVAIERMAIAFAPSPAQEAELDALLAAQRDPGSPQYQRWLSPDEFAARFGTSDADLAAVGAWLRSHGLEVHGAARSRSELYFSGSAAQIEDAFQTELHRYLVRGRLHYANAFEPSVPAAFAGVVQAIRKLDDFRPRPRVRHIVVSDRFTSSISGSHFIAPDDFATIYGVKPLYAAGFDGTGQKLAVVGQSALGAQGSTADVDAFRAAAGLPATHLKQVLVPSTGSATVCSGDVDEADLDVEWSGATAPGATVVFVYVGVASGKTCATTGASIWDALQYAVSNDVAPVISTSYGACEAANGSAFAKTVRSWVRQGNAQGQTIVAAAGDSGAADCESPNSVSATTGLAVDMPASIPEVTAAGGTELADQSDPSAYWSATNDAANGSALGYIPETGWNDTASAIAAGGGLSAGGGGPSALFAKPGWQTGAGVPADGQRDVPDLAFSSSSAHDGYLICSGGRCVNGFRDTDQTLDVIGGTSVAAPSFAGILAVIAGGTGSSGLGNVNPNLYAVAASAPAAFHDVTSGDNLVPCTAGTPDCPAHAPFELGFSAGPGYDRVTGLGSPDAGVLANGWAAKIATATSLALSDPAPPIGSTETLTATVTPASAGAGSPAGGAVQFGVDGVDVGAPVAVAPSGGAYRASYSTSALPTGAHSAGARYLGNLVYTASAAAPVAFSVADFALAADPNAFSLAPGGSATSTVTVSSASGFSGTVALACAPSNPNAEITCSFQPATVTLGAGATSASATLTVATAAPHAGSASAARWLGGEALAAVALLGLPLRRRRSRAGLACLAFAALLGGASCGGGGGGGGSAKVARPAAPANVVATPGNAQISLAWTEASVVKHFDVARSQSSAGPFAKVASPTSPSFTDTGLTGGTTYYYVIDAVNAGGKSKTSSPVAATPGNPGTPAGSYAISVTATSGSAQHALSLPLTVQ